MAIDEPLTRSAARAANEPPPPPKRFAWSDVLAMAQAGVFEEGERVELIGGEVFAMPPEGPRHADMVQVLARWFLRNLPPAMELYVRAPVILHDGVVVPDLSVFPTGTASKNMRASAAALIVEVADSTIRHDLVRKAPRYAAAWAPEFWLVGAEEAVVTVFSAPSDGKWGQEAHFGPGQTIAPAFAPGLAFPIDLLNA